MIRIWQALGWLVAVALASLVPAFAIWLEASPASAGDWAASRGWAVLVYLSFRTAVMFGFPLVIVLGLPLVLIFRRIGWTGPIAAAFGGFLIGGIGILIWGSLIGDVSQGSMRAAEMAASVIRSGMQGAVGGLAFWFTLRFWPKAASDV